MQDIYIKKIIIKYQFINQPKPKTLIINDVILLYEQQINDYKILLY